MEKIIAILLLTLCLGACGKKPAQPAEPTEATQITTAPTELTEATIAPTETIEVTVPTDSTETVAPITVAPAESVATQVTAVATRPATIATQAASISTQKATVATQATAIATKPATLATKAPTKPATVATQATTVYTKPTVVTTQATTISTKPATVATQPVSPTQHTHSYTSQVIAASCTAEGYTKYTCACGDSYTDSKTPARHGTTRTETKEATTAAEGYTRVICNTCGAVISETKLPKLEDTHTCTMERINCKDLQDGAVGINTDKFKRYTNVTILACSKCGTADTSSMKFVYSSSEASAIIVEMINQLRYEVYGTHAYDVQVATHHSAAEWSAEYISTDYQHCVPFANNNGHENLSGDIVDKLFNSWKNSPGHYALLIDKMRTYCSLGVSVGEDGSIYATLIIHNKDELYLDNPNYTWDYR